MIRAGLLLTGVLLLIAAAGVLLSACASTTSNKPMARATGLAPVQTSQTEAQTASAVGKGSAMPDTKSKSIKTQKATFAAGCFWGVEATFRQVPGVVATAVGYSGGTTENPTYETVCSHGTGHAESVQVEYDPSKVSYDKLLEVFWANHDPTTPDRQGPDFGSQYRSVIFYHTPEQEAAAKASKERLEKSGRFGRPIVTQIVPAAPFYLAEDYHQQYLEKRGLSSCHIGAR